MLTVRTLKARRATNSSIYRRRLKPGHIRVLDLHPSSDPSAPIEGDLILVDLYTANIAYRAVSYCWGNEPLSRCITINGKQFWIRPNLERLLVDLRHEHDNRTLFVDFLCIDQEDVMERNVQVRLMSDVYSRAISVFIWLDEERSDSIHTLDSQQSSICYTTSGAAKQLSALSKTEENLPHDTEFFVQSVRWLLGHPHFTRVWTVAECALAKHVDVRCGNHQFCLDTLAKLLENQQPVKAETAGALQTHKHCLASQFCALNTLTRKEPRGGRLTDLLQQFRHNDCSDPRDKVFALLSVSPRARDRITIDYRETAETVLVEVLEYVTQYENLGTESSMVFGQMMMDMLHLNDSTDPSRLSRSIFLGKTDCQVQGYFQTQLLHVATVTEPTPDLYNHAQRLQETMSKRRFRTFSPLRLGDFGPIGPHTYIEDMSPQDLHPFTWQSRRQVTSPAVDHIRYGLATVDVKPGHLICVFRGWDTALIVDRRSDEFIIIGRALIRAQSISGIDTGRALTSNDLSYWSACRVSAENDGETGEQLIVTSRGASTMSLLQLGVPLERVSGR
jgi:hypothetical protein